MTSLQLGWVVLALVPALGFAAKDPRRDKIHGLDKAPKVVKVPRPDLQYASPGGASFQNCHRFKDLVVVEVDSGQKGADAIFIRPEKAGESSDKICGAAPWPEEKKLSSSEQYFLGRSGGYLFTISADTFGELGQIWVYDAATGAQVFRSDYHANRPYRVKRQDKTLSLEFHRFLPTNCTPNGKVPECWKTTLKLNRIPEGVKIQEPECPAGTVLVFAEFRVDDLAGRKSRFLGGKALCHLAP